MGETATGTRRQRALEVAEAAGCEVVLAVEPATVTWLTGYTPPLGITERPWAVSPIALIESDGRATIIVSADEVAAAEHTGCRVISYPGFGIGELEPFRAANAATQALVGGRRVASEAAGLRGPLWERLDWVDASGGFALARAVKDDDELNLLRGVITVADSGQAAARRGARSGKTEFELWLEVRAAMDRAAGAAIASHADLVSGPNVARFEGMPGHDEIQEGKLLIADVVPRLRGYWGGSCSTFAVGEVPDSATRLHRLVRERLLSGTDAVRPGLTAGELDSLLREGLHYPHHSGHGIGTSYHEEPRIVPHWPTILAPNMVIALEPAHYVEDHGVRLEWVVRVTDDGCEILSGHALDL